MNTGKWLPIRKRDKHLPAERDEHNPFMELHREMNRLFDEFFTDFSPVPAGTRGRGFDFAGVKVDMAENDNELVVTAEVPGLEEKDIDVSLSRGMLSIRGERKEEKKKEGDNYYYMERSSGSFHRELPLPDYVDIDKAEASLKNGVLRLSMPKKAEAMEQRKTIKVKTQ